MTNNITAWSLVTHGTPVAVGYEGLESARGEFHPGLPWLRHSERGPLAQYPPGAALTALPVYGIARLLDSQGPPFAELGPATGTIVVGHYPPRWPGVVAGALSTALAGGLVALSVAHHDGRRTALIAAGVFGLGTTAWTVAGTDLWQHGPGMLWLTAAVFAAQRGHDGRAGLALALAILVRPHTALIAAGIGLGAGLARRSVRPVLTIGILSSLGLVGLISFNAWAFGSPSITGGYSSTFAENLTGSGADQWRWYGANIARGLFSPHYGLMVYAPFLLVLLPGLAAGWRRADPVARWAAVGGLAFLLVQWKANRASGGSAFWAYRYPLETLSVSVLLAVAAWQALDAGHWARRALVPAVAVAVALQAAGLMVSLG